MTWHEEKRTGLNILGGVLLLAALSGTIVLPISGVVAKQRYERTISFGWELADRSSTLDAKCGHMSSFLGALKEHRHEFADWGDFFIHSPQTNTDAQIRVLLTLRDRLYEIQSMDPKTPEYQWAIQQITAQEQGEAQATLEILREAWNLGTYPFLYLYFVVLESVLIILGYIFGGWLLTLGPRSVYRET